LIGCGGRGTGAAGEALAADKNVVLTAMADVFEDKLKASLEILRQQAPDKVKVEPDHCFVGLDAYQKLIDSGVDVVLLTTPPGISSRPSQGGGRGRQTYLLREAGGDRRAGRALGARNGRGSPAKNLALVAGFCWRYNLAERALLSGFTTATSAMCGPCMRLITPAPSAGPCPRPASVLPAWAIWNGNCGIGITLAGCPGTVWWNKRSMPWIGCSGR
jgi:hypothetical protein